MPWPMTIFLCSLTPSVMGQPLFFGETPYGVRREGLVSDGGETFNNTWDIKWNAETQQFHNYFTAEIAIPFSSLKFVEGSTRWRFINLKLTYWINW